MKDDFDNTNDAAMGRRYRERFERAYRDRFGDEYDWSSPQGSLLSRIFGNSHFLSEKLIARPDWALLHSRDPFFDSRKPREVAAREMDALLSTVDKDAAREFGDVLRQFKYRELLRIISRDLSSSPDTGALLHEWSDIADILIDRAYAACRESLVKTHGPHSNGTVIALGKLGAQELNISSDVDLLFIYETDEDTQDHIALTNHEFHVKLTSALTKMLGTVTPEGFVFRVDHELRPEGIQGPLANSIDAAVRYYEYFGHDWERQAMIRARPVAGDVELGNRFINDIRPFVFRKSMGLAELQAMKRMKERMISEGVRQDEVNLKLCHGGIRSVEFLVQAFQTIYGGKIKRLQATNTFGALKILTEERLIHPANAQRLGEAYSFLRKSENMLQALWEKQTHVLPEDNAGISALAVRVGFGNETNPAKAFMQNFENHTSYVQRLLDGIFEKNYERIELKQAIEENLTSCATEEETFDSIPWFKHQEVRRIQHLDLEGKLGICDVLSRLTLVAEIVISNAATIARDILVKKYGAPRAPDESTSEMAIIGLGKLGGREIDYGSDLDLCFIYSSDGQTDGPRPIENSEFFSRLAQRIISLISIRSRYGRAYEVDSSLRPSGASGALVTSLASFRHYHSGTSKDIDFGGPPSGGSALWERISLMRARVIDGPKQLADRLAKILNTFAFEAPPPDESLALSETLNIRRRVWEEWGAEDNGRYNIKHARGGSDDLDSILHQYQLRYASTQNELRVTNMFDLTTALHGTGIIDDQSYDDFSQTLTFYRKLLSRVRLFAASSTNELDIRSEQAASIAAQMGFDSSQILERELLRHRSLVRRYFDGIFSDV